MNVCYSSLSKPRPILSALYLGSFEFAGILHKIHNYLLNLLNIGTYTNYSCTSKAGNKKH